MSNIGEHEVIWKGKKFFLETVTVRGNDGSQLRREVIRHPGAVCILPILEESDSPDRVKVVITRQLRHTLGREIWEFPAGTIEPGEPPEKCAPRELEEEAGYRAKSMDRLGSFYTTPGMTDELMHAFVARGLEHVGQKLEVYETIRPEVVTAAEVFEMLDRGEFIDAKSMVTLHLAARQGLLGSRG
ncbi:MAG TPA: NUDIX hydrolase [Phycisphaerales bacterium]|nr:NUDIX hydrolase [Phycisphaerales bacterium]